MGSSQHLLRSILLGPDVERGEEAGASAMRPKKFQEPKLQIRKKSRIPKRECHPPRPLMRREQSGREDWAELTRRRALSECSMFRTVFTIHSVFRRPERGCLSRGNARFRTD